MALVLALHRAGRTDVAVVGFGDIPMSLALQPAVTVIDQDPANLGRIAVERLVQRIEHPDAPPRRRTVLPVHLIPRGSGELAPPAP
jgi:LacI family transcriptional regulator